MQYLTANLTMSSKKYTFIDLFAGCGGLSEGFLESEHFRGLAHVEWELPMVQTLRNRLIKKWGESEGEALKDVVYFDIQKTEELICGNWSEESIAKYGENNSSEALLGLKHIIGKERVDFIIGGPPCQAYSIHGRATDKNSMQDDYRNYLFESFVKVVNAFKPRAFIFENVTGMLSAKPGGKPVVDRIYSAFTNIGYEVLRPHSFKDAIYDTYNYDVPQKRKRVILFGVREGENLSLSDFYSALSRNASNKRLTVRDVLGDLPPIYPLPKVEKVKGKNVSHKSIDCSDKWHLPRHCSERDIKLIREWIANDMNYCSQQEAIDLTIVRNPS